jgi:hypothetical protein
MTMNATTLCLTISFDEAEPEQIEADLEQKSELFPF